MKAIKTIHLTKKYGKNRGIEDLNLTVEKGDFFGFIGPNGAGKSTTIRTLLGMIHLTSGSAEVLGMDVKQDRLRILRNTGYLPSESVFYEGMKVKDILKFSADLRKMDCRVEAKRLCERLELDTTRKVEELSLGNRKKVAIVCALQSRPELLVLDEPTSGLDPLMQREFFQILKERNKEGTTIFLSSHVLSEVQHNCNRAAIIREGSVIACDKVDALAKSSARRVTVQGKVDLSGLEGIYDKNVEAEGCSFLFGGDLNVLLQRFAQGNVKNLTIAEPDLEEIFLHFYEKAGDRS